MKRERTVVNVSDEQKQEQLTQLIKQQDRMQKTMTQEQIKQEELVRSFESIQVPLVKTEWAQNEGPVKRFANHICHFFCFRSGRDDRRLAPGNNQKWRPSLAWVNVRKPRWRGREV